MHILPDVLIDNFDIVNFDKSADRFDIYLGQRNNLRDFIGSADFPGW